MGIEKLLRLGIWVCVVIFILMFTLLIIIGHSTSFDYYYSR